MTKRQKKSLRRILFAAALLLFALLLQELLFPLLALPSPVGELLSLALFLIPYAVIGADVIKTALRNLFRGALLDEQFLMAVATVGAFALGEYTEGVAVMLLYQIGELFQGIAVGNSRRSIAALMDLRPDTARVLRGGEEMILSPEEVSVGDEILVFPGERVPLDGVLLSDGGTLDTSALTGESLPRDVVAGDPVPSGTLSLDAPLRLRVTGLYEESTVSRILTLVEEASEKKAHVEKFITRFAHVYTPVVVGLALTLAVLPPFFDQFLFGKWISRALTFLVVSCPCALVISVPLTFFSAIGGASRMGILVKGSTAFDALARVDQFVFDKTGTLTRGSFRVVEVAPVSGSREELLSLAATLEAHASHPIARAILEEAPAPNRLPDELREHPGMGIEAILDGEHFFAGNLRLMEKAEAFAAPADGLGTVVYLAKAGSYLGYICLSDEIKGEATAAMRDLRRIGTRRAVMLTGDRRAIGEAVAAEIGLDGAVCELFPDEKVARLEEMLGKGNTVAYVGDGINDAPALALADVGIAMGGLGSDAAMEAADLVLLDDDLRKLPAAVRLARRVRRIVRQNIVFSLGVKLAVLALGAIGYADMWLAIFADVGVMVLATLNAMRAMRIRGAAQHSK